MGLFMKELEKKIESGMTNVNQFIFPIYDTQYTLSKSIKGKSKANLNFPSKDFKFDEGKLTLNDTAGLVFEDSSS